jgi:hypothetical protein
LFKASAINTEVFNKTFNRSWLPSVIFSKVVFKLNKEVSVFFISLSILFAVGSSEGSNGVALVIFKAFCRLESSICCIVSNVFWSPSDTSLKADGSLNSSSYFAKLFTPFEAFSELV